MTLKDIYIGQYHQAKWHSYTDKKFKRDKVNSQGEIRGQTLLQPCKNYTLLDLFHPGLTRVAVNYSIKISFFILFF